MKRSKLSIISFILTTLIIVSSIPVSSVADGECHFDDTSSYPISQKSDYSYVDDIVSEEIKEEHADALSCRITDYVDKEQFESQNYAFRVEHEESLNTYVFQTDDGKRAVYFLDENVKFIDNNGEIKEKNLSLKSVEKGFLPICNDIDILLPITTAESIQFNYGKSSISIAPSGDALIEGKSDGRSVSYTGVFGENTILRYTPMLSGLKEDIIVTDQTVPSEYSFVLKTNGLFVYTDEDGFYLATYERSEEKIRLGNVVAYDSGDEYVITVSVDPDFLVNESTVFPVTIDPTITVSDNTHGANAIQDAPIFQGYPNSNFGTYLYNRVGTPDSSYGVGRTVVKLSGFTSSVEYTSIPVSKITSVLFYARESSGGSTQTINLHPITSVTSWTESTVTWNTIGTNFNSSVNYGGNMSGSQWTAFDITYLVKDWKNNLYAANCGFLLKNSNESNNKSFYSCEYTTTSYRPYVVMTYDVQISLNIASADVDEGSTLALTATTSPSGLTVSWSSSDTVAATVNSNGVVTAISARSSYVTITASVTVDGSTYSASCQVYVTVADGVYYLKNQNSSLYMTVSGGGITSPTDVIQYGKYNSSYAEALRITQMWKIKYLGSGKYSVRPMHKLNMGLDVSAGNVDIYSIGENDTISGVPYYARWSIERYSNSSTGCIFKNDGDSSYSMHIAGNQVTPGVTVIAGPYSSTAEYRWTLESIASPPDGVILYDTSTNAYTINPTRYIAPEEALSLDGLNLTFAVYSGITNQQAVHWFSSDTSKATVDYDSGTVTGVSGGTVTITARRYLNGAYRTASYSLVVTEVANGTYFLKNKQNSDYARVKNGTMSNNQNAVQYDLDGSDYERWFFRLNNFTGYYSIKSVASPSTTSYYLAVKDDSNALDHQIVIRSATESTLTDGMKWKVEQTTSGAYKIIPKTGEANDYVLATGSSLGTNNVNLVQGDYIQNNSYRDEWFLLKIGCASTVSLEGQKKSNWCWVASSRMFSKHFYNTVSYTQNQAVVYVKGSEINEAGTNAEIIMAINYYISSVSGTSLSLSSKYHNIYTESTLVDFLDDGYVVAIGRGWYTNISDPDSINGAHETLIVGYVEQAGELWFIVHDPWPVNSGETYLMSYEKMVNGRNPQSGESADTGIWIDCVVINTTYSNNTIDYYFGS